MRVRRRQEQQAVVRRGGAGPATPRLKRGGLGPRLVKLGRRRCCAASVAGPRKGNNR